MSVCTWPCMYSHMDMQWWCSLFLQPSSHTVRLSSSSMSSRQIGHICSSSSFMLHMGYTPTLSSALPHWPFLKQIFLTWNCHFETGSHNGGCDLAEMLILTNVRILLEHRCFSRLQGNSIVLKCKNPPSIFSPRKKLFPHPSKPTKNNDINLILIQR